MAIRRTNTEKLAIKDHVVAMEKAGYDLRETAASLAEHGIVWDKSRISAARKDNREILEAKVKAEKTAYRKKGRKLPKPPVFTMPPSPPAGNSNGNGKAKDKDDDPNYWLARERRLKVEKLEEKLLDAKEQYRLWLPVLMEIATGIDELDARVEMLAPDTPENTMAVLRKEKRRLLKKCAGIDPRKVR